jgi:3-deoxy-D-manno-octulosonic-acid transferase
VPRHPQRFDKVDKLIKSYITNDDTTYSRFSRKTTFDTDIVLVDCLGELVNIYAISDAVILGGAFVKVGGHNPVEPVSFDNILISGKHIFNQHSLFEFIDGYHIINKKDLKETMQNIKTYKPAKLSNIGDNQTIIQHIKDTIR